MVITLLSDANNGIWSIKINILDSQYYTTVIFF